MRLWLSKTSDIPLPEQLATQLILGIVSGDLKSGERLPSTSQLATRFRIHANTARTAYRTLARRGWVEWRAGSGFFVRESTDGSPGEPNQDLDQLIAAVFEIARSRGHSLSEIHSRITQWLRLQPPDHVLVIEPDSDLREILVFEIHNSTGKPVVGGGIEACSNQQKLSRALCVALVHRKDDVRSRLKAEIPCLFLQSQSVPMALTGESKPSAETPVTVVSRWPTFLDRARTILIAVGVDPLALDLRDARTKGWKRALSERSLIISDSLVARELPQGCRPRIFKIIAADSLAEISRRLR